MKQSYEFRQAFKELFHRRPFGCRTYSTSCRLHSALISAARGIVPTGDDYAAVNGLHCAVIDAIRRLTGEEPAWMQLRTSEGGKKWGT